MLLILFPMQNQMSQIELLSLPFSTYYHLESIPLIGFYDCLHHCTHYSLPQPPPLRQLIIVIIIEKNIIHVLLTCRITSINKTKINRKHVRHMLRTFSLPPSVLLNTRVERGADATFLMTLTFDGASFSGLV